HLGWRRSQGNPIVSPMNTGRQRVLEDLEISVMDEKALMKPDLAPSCEEADIQASSAHSWAYQPRVSPYDERF
ncbi:MAG: hypothetical protein ACYC8V_06300, partial [Caulobacteraceae bacterium]